MVMERHNYGKIIGVRKISINYTDLGVHLLDIFDFWFEYILINLIQILEKKMN